MELKNYSDFTCDRSILVHCMAGKSRSVSIVWSYLISKGTDPLDAYLKIKKERVIVDPYPMFLTEILAAFNMPDAYVKTTAKQIADINKMFRS